MLDSIVNECLAVGVTVRFESSEFVEVEGSPCSGYFDDEAKLLVVATGNPEWMFILYHEYSHFRQWSKSSPVWEDYKKQSDIDVFKWLDGEEYQEEEIYKAIDAVMLVEHDCEKRVINLLKSVGYNSSVIEEYSQKANAYVLFYHQVKATRKWYATDAVPYKTESIWRNMPKVLVENPLSEDSIKLVRGG